MAEKKSRGIEGLTMKARVEVRDKTRDVLVSDDHESEKDRSE